MERIRDAIEEDAGILVNVFVGSGQPLEHRASVDDAVKKWKHSRNGWCRHQRVTVLSLDMKSHKYLIIVGECWNQPICVGNLEEKQFNCQQ